MKMHGPNIISPRAFFNSKVNFYFIKCYVSLSTGFDSILTVVFSIAGAEDVDVWLPC